MGKFESKVTNKVLAHCHATDTNAKDFFLKYFELDRIANLRISVVENETELKNVFFDYCQNNFTLDFELEYQKEAGVLNTLVFGSERPRQRNEANEFQLALMNDLQKYNIYLLQKNTKNRLPLLMERKNVFIYMNKKP
jgi:hypothetical protein